MVGMTDNEAALFAEFQKRYAFIKLLESVDAFNLKSGTLTVNFDALGQIGSIEIHKHYRL